MSLLRAGVKAASCGSIAVSSSLRTPICGAGLQALTRMHASTISSSSIGLDKATGIAKPALYRNLSYPDIYEHEVAGKEGVTASNGAFTVTTGKFTGRSPKDKFFVKQAPSEKYLDWGKVNMPVTLQVYKDVYQRAVDHYNNNVKNAYVFDGFCGTNPKSRKAVRIVTELAWQHHFVKNMFIRAESEEEVKDFKPDFTIINACKVTNPDWKEKKLNSDVACIFNVEDRMAVITGTWYGGEMKKGVFSMMNYWLPLEGIMAMHCSANKGKGGDTCLFFGLSGTGKTTLSADPNRFLIGDDEHGWDDDGIFNFEGGCYAKTIKLRRENEPEIYDAIKRDALLENVKILPNGDVDYDDKSITENGRVSYPIYHIANYEPTGMGGHPANVIFLTCDAFGVLPPVSKLSEGQAMYHFLSGYTAKVAGTERGITEPVPNFSACFGAAFMTLHPTKYADLLKLKLQKHQTKCYLVNTGWTGGAYGVGERMSIKATRSCIDAILDGSIEKAPTTTDSIFGFEIPTKLNGVPASVLDPKQAWTDKAAYEEAHQKLAGMFKKNYEQFRKPGMTDYASFGPK